MCLAIPGKLIEVARDPSGIRMGKANFGGIVKQVCLEYTPEVEMGDYVLVHVGFALSKVNEEEAARTYKLLEEMKQLGELNTPDLDESLFSEEQFFTPSPPSSQHPARSRALRGHEAAGEGNGSASARNSSSPAGTDASLR